MSADLTLEALIQVGMAMFGSLARLLNSNNTALKINRILSDLFVAGFTGMLLYWATCELQAPKSVLFATAGVAGWIGPKTLDKIMDFIGKKTGINLTGADEAPP